jgi:transposase
MKADMNLNKTHMWYKIKELKDKGLNKSQIALELDISRKTVRRYLAMEAGTFQNWINQGKGLPLKLADYFAFVRKLLTDHPYLSSAQIEDRLKEHFSDLPLVHPKTIYNFVQHVRQLANIPKPVSEKHREFELLPTVGYGQEAQVDFGVYTMKNKEGKRIKVWFFVMVLSRSRQKYIYFQNHPFTTATAIQAHQRAFIYFQGVPHKIIYDQDRVFMVDENLGDLLLTSGFEHYIRGESFEAIFCRKADPQSKGKVENVVKYVKYNFLQGRIFSGIDNLNESALGWLMRTGNGKRHATTRLIPHQEWLKEKDYLLPIRKQMLIDLPEFISYKVRKDNTISYKGNYYSLPLGTYKNQESSVLVRVDESNLNLYDLQKNLLAVHTISVLKGRLITISDHKRDKSKNLEQRKIEVMVRLGETEMAREFIEALARSKPRYLNDNLRTLLLKLNNPEQAILNQALDYCLNNQVYNAMRFVEIINHYQGLEVTEKHQAHLSSQTHLNSYTLPKQAHQVPETSQINIYQKILNL